MLPDGLLYCKYGHYTGIRYWQSSYERILSYRYSISQRFFLNEKIKEILKE